MINFYIFIIYFKYIFCKFGPRNSKLSKEKLQQAGFELLPTWQDATERYCKELKKIVITIDKTKIVTRLMQGQFPKYNQLIPQTFPKEATVNKSNLISALERVAVMVSEKNSIVKFEFVDNTLKLSGDSPEAGNSQDEIDIKYMGEPLAIAFNYKFILEFLKIAESEDIKIQLNTPLSATVFAPCSEEDYIYLVMPVQLRS